MDNRCRICGSASVHAPVQIREMMFGLRDVFDYIECKECGCLQILRYPEHIERYYPKEYYSFNLNLPAPRTSTTARIVLFIKYIARLAWHKLSRSYQAPWPVRLRLLPRHKVLDIGCGNGARMMEWYNLGMNRLQGIDEYIDQGRTIAPRVNIMKGNFYLLDEQYDVVMMNETLEHLPDQSRVFRKVNELLHSGGMFFIRIPVKSWAWEHYGTNWVQLDAPRHYYIHTERSLTMLATRTGFVLEDIIYDSWAFQFTGSELYKKNIPLTEGKKGSFFSPEEMEEFRARARQLNRERKGDQAAFILRKAATP